jgi:hypothetical protein
MMSVLVNRSDRPQLRAESADRMRLKARLPCVAFTLLARCRATGWTANPEHLFRFARLFHGAHIVA